MDTLVGESKTSHERCVLTTEMTKRLHVAHTSAIRGMDGAMPDMVMAGVKHNLSSVITDTCRV